MTIDDRVDPLFRIKKWFRETRAKITAALDKLQDPDKKRMKEDLDNAYKQKYNEIFLAERKKFLEKKAERDAKKAAQRDGLFSGLGS